MTTFSFQVLGPLTKHGPEWGWAFVRYQTHVAIRLGQVRRRYRVLCGSGASKQVLDIYLQEWQRLHKINKRHRRLVSA